MLDCDILAAAAGQLGRAGAAPYNPRVVSSNSSSTE